MFGTCRISRIEVSEGRNKAGGMRELSILVADDSEIIRHLLLTVLGGINGLKLLGLAEDGAEAVRMFGDFRPDILVLDISMPNKNGIDVLRHVRKFDSESIIIMFTADPSLTLRATCLNLGANFCLDKTQICDLVRICKELLQRKRVGGCQQPSAQCG